MKALLLLLAALTLPLLSPAATQITILGPPGSGTFGEEVTVLPNGNFVVVNHGYDQVSPPLANAGAVYLYSPQGALISTLIGSQTGDGVGSGGITVLASGHFIVSSPSWENGLVDSAGAVTFGHAQTGFGFGQVVAVSTTNSLVGTQTNDYVGLNGVTPLTNGHYVVRSQSWDNGGVTNAGAVTWGNGFSGIAGPVTPANSLVGSQANDYVGSSGVIALTNGHYIVRSQSWDNGGVTNAGAVTWGNGFSGVTGPVTPDNSLVGSKASDQVGITGVIGLTSGHYIVHSLGWDNGAILNAGAVTWGNGFSGITGPISPANSLVGSQSFDLAGSSVTALTNGHYVVASPSWNNGAVNGVGAVTWGNGTTGITGPVTPANSLVGSQTSDLVGRSVSALTNGHYVVSSPFWSNGAVAQAGAVTWGSGTTGIRGPVTPANSLIGSQQSDRVGNSGVTALTNGHYVVSSPYWNNVTATAAGAATWCNGFSGSTGPVTPANSLVGSQNNDDVGIGGVTALTNGHYVVSSWYWDNDALTSAGAVTWGNGTKGIIGPVTPLNSLVGSQNHHNVGGGGVTALTNGHYVVNSTSWHNGIAYGVGAITWSNGFSGITGTVSPTNSLVGSQADDRVGTAGVTALANGHYVVLSPNWDNGAIADAGAATWGNGFSGITGPVTPANSLVGSQTILAGGSNSVTALTNGYFVVRCENWSNSALLNTGVVIFGNGDTGTVGLADATNSVLGAAEFGGSSLTFAYNPVSLQLIVGDRKANRVTLLTPDRLHSLAKSTQDAPGAVDIAFGTPGTLAVGPDGTALFNTTLTGTGAKSGNRALFAPGLGGGPLELVLRLGDPISTLDATLPPNAAVTTLTTPLRQQPARGLFQATAKGTGLTPANNRLLLLDEPAGVRLLLRAGQPLTALTSATLNRPLEVAQSHDQNLIALTYTLNKSTTPLVTSSNDSGLLLLDHNGTLLPNTVARESLPAFGGGGSFGQFTGRIVAGQGTTLHFSALFKPIGPAVAALFRTTIDGLTTARTAAVGDPAPGTAPATFASFRGLSQLGPDALFTATLKGSPTTTNEGLWRGDGSPVLTRKGDTIAPSLTLTRLLRFWPAGSDKVILQAQLSDNSQALILRQENATYLILLRTGQHAPGVSPAKLQTLSAIDVNPVTGHYTALGTLTAAPATSNQALWSGNPTLGNATTETVYRLPVLRLRKGQTYRTDATPQGILRSISLKPAFDTSGAGGRGLSQAIGSSGQIALILTGDRKLLEAVVLR